MHAAPIAPREVRVGRNDNAPAEHRLVSGHHAAVEGDGALESHYLADGAIADVLVEE